MRCPGQDMQYWKGDAAFDVPCPKCGEGVEFFKDENSGRCRKCGHRFSNPKLTFDCANWCAYAEECLGIAPGTPSAADAGQAALAGRLLTAVEEHFKDDPDAQARALLVFQHARELVSKEPCDARLVLAGTLLSELDTPSAAMGEAELGRFLVPVGFETHTIEQVGHLLEELRQGVDSGSVEARVVADARRLARMATGAQKTVAQSSDTEDSRAAELERIISDELHTEAAKDRARGLFLA